MKTEEDVKNNIVLPWLKELGFNESELQFERTLKVRVGRGEVEIGADDEKQFKSGRYDILVTRNGVNLFVVEVKAQISKSLKRMLSKPLPTRCSSIPLLHLSW